VPSGLRATSQFEALAQSVCKKQSGDALSCTSCHNPHQVVPSENKAAFYRGKCIACHGAVFATKHHPKQPDCVACHMPRSSSSDVAHTQVTDHRVLRRPEMNSSVPLASTALPDLLPFPPSEQSAKDTRDLALAWQSVVTSGMTMAEPQAAQLLREALKNSPDDPALLSALAYTAQEHGKFDQSRSLYKRALEQDPTLVDAATNLGVLEAQQGHMTEAIRLWQSAFDRDPGKSEIGMNLARAFCDAGQLENARNSVVRVLRFNPDLTSAKKLSAGLNSSTPRCVL
jgi:tetratricopeptide (TPR) repeat protein